MGSWSLLFVESQNLDWPAQPDAYSPIECTLSYNKTLEKYILESKQNNA